MKSHNLLRTDQTRKLFLAVYSATGEGSSFSTLDDLRAYKFLNNNNTVLKLLPPTEDAFFQHLKRAGLATIIDKTAHIAKQDLPSPEDYGWTVEGDRFVPTAMTQSAWPQDMDKGISCHCKKGCVINCTCGKQSVACYIGCKCTGSSAKCSRAPDRRATCYQ